MEQVGDVGEGQVVESSEGEQSYLGGDVVRDGGPVQLVECRSDVEGGGACGDDPSCSNLDDLEFADGFEWQTGEKRTAVIKM